MQSVIHVPSGDETEQRTAFAIAENLLADEEIDDIVLVVQADGIGAIKAGGENEDTVRALLDDDVAVKACENTLDGRGLADSDLVEGVETVPEGAVEVTRLQADGYGYVRP
ncbi:DsrE family protein [Halobacteria archaeon AArc-dxtr1]|nr:DsrE family protein [Halobacteria archaeon AArc-dxtr1]